MQGKNFLKVTGIIMIVGGGISLIVSLIAIAGIATLAALGASSGLLTFAGILAVVGSVAELVAGILGVANCSKPEKANVCLTFGVIIIVINVLSTILSVAAGGSFSIVSLLTGMILPVLYIVGAVKNKQA